MSELESKLFNEFLYAPNDDVTRSQIVEAVNDYLEDLKKRKGIYDHRVIRCDDLIGPFTPDVT